MEKLDPSVAQQIAHAAIAFQRQRTTGIEPHSATVVPSGITEVLVVRQCKLDSFGCHAHAYVGMRIAEKPCFMPTQTWSMAPVKYDLQNH